MKTVAVWAFVGAIVLSGAPPLVVGIIVVAVAMLVVFGK